MSEQRETRPGSVFLEGEVTSATTEERAGKSYTTVTVRETSGQYPTELAFQYGGKFLERAKDTAVGDTVRCEGYVSSRSYNGKWYTNVRGTWLKTLSRGQRKEPAPPPEDPNLPPPDDSEIPF